MHENRQGIKNKIFNNEISVKPSKGMTLIELILVILIISILSAIAIPKGGIDFSQRASLDGAAYMIASDIRYAQECAMTTQASKSINFTTGSSVYTFHPQGTFDPSGQLPSGIRIDNNFTVTFNSLGEPVVGGGGSVSISSGSQARTINIITYTGKVNIY
ncbi:MAG: prepilin-type N-terminal cleavage/methylation domain-containing protein [Thermodesulfobacteriota bacterium]